MQPSTLMKSFVLSVMIFITGAVKATDYYVSTSGSNSNNGTSSTTPWQTLSKVQTVCNNGTIHAGDRILFKKGDIFTGTLLVATIWGNHANSGTATNPITLSSYGTGEKPTFLYPQNSGIAVEDRYLMWFVGVNYYVIDGLKFTDSNTTNDHKTPGACGTPIYLGANGEATTNHFLIQNVDISLCGMGIVLIGDFNTVTNCSMTDFKELKSTPDTGGSTAYEDYGANALTIISGSDNEITNNYISGAWAESLDFGWNGGACEIFNSCNRNKLMYNTFYDCGGVSEFGADEGGASASDNLFAYNKIINCGGLTWCNISGNFAIQVSNNQYFNNVIIENNASRFSGPNTGMGITTPSALALIYPETLLFAYNGSPSAQYVFNLKNNVFNLSTGIDVVRNNDPKTTHANNIYKLSGGSTANVTLAGTELSTSAAVFTNTTTADPISWNYAPITGSPAIDFGQNLGLSPDFAGNPVPTVPNAGILESGSGTSTLTASSTSGTIACNGGTTTVTVTATGGVTPYTGTGTFTVGAGTYTYTVSDAAGTNKTTSITITQPATITVTLSAGTIGVYGGTTNLTVTATGGTGAYTYKLNSGSYQSGNSFSGVAAGTHTVTVKDANGCTSLKNITITQPSAFTASSTAGTIACSGETTTVTVTASGGTAPYSGAGSFNAGAGLHSYTVTDANGASAITSVTITEPSAILVTLNAGVIGSFGGTTTLTVTATGGTGAYTYKLNSGSYQASNTFINIPAGTYTVTVKDANGCNSVKNITITQPLALSATSTAGSINCNGGSTTVTVTASGGTAPYSGTGNFTAAAGTHTYNVTDANGASASTSITIAEPSAIVATLSAGTITVYGGTTSITVNATGGTGAYMFKLDAGLYQSGSTFNNVAAGMHTIKVKDANGCISTQSITLTQPPAPGPLTASSTSGTIDCNGGTTIVTVSAGGGTAPYTGTGTFTVSAGTYNYTVTDANGVSATTSITVTQPTVITVSVSSGTITVYGGTTLVAVNAGGGTGAYTYKLDAGSYQASNTFTAVFAGNHSVTVKDDNGCTSVKNFTLSQPAQVDPLVASATATAIGCNGGTSVVTVTASGGTAPYSGTGTFNVPAGNYNYTVTDVNGLTSTTSVAITQPAAINVTVTTGTITVYGGTTSATVSVSGGTGAYTYKLDAGSYQSSNTFTGIAAGDHSITVKDANGCTSVKTFTLTQPANNALVVTAIPTAIVCNGNISTITVSATGGTAPYTGTGLYTGYAGTYSYTVTDAAGNTASTTLIITQPVAIAVSVTAGTITVAGQTTTVTAAATGGTAAYSYDLDGLGFQAGSTFTNVPAGSHAVTVKDVNGCSSVKTFTINNPGSHNFRVSLIAQSNAICRGGNTGLIQVLASGGHAPYTYQLNNGRFTTAATFRNLVSGFYRVNAKDANGNIATLITFVFDGRTLCTSGATDGRLNLTTYPNPTADKFSLTIESNHQDDVTVEVMDFNGRKVFEGKGSVYKNYIFGQDFKNGTYFVRVTQGKDVKTMKLIKTN